VTTPLELATPITHADASARRHLERLMASWGLLADLSFSDLLLYVPLEQVTPFGEPHAAPTGAPTGDLPAGRGERPGGAPSGDGADPGSTDNGSGHDRTRRLVVLGQIRPTTSPTLLELDLVGQVVAASAEPLVVSAFNEGVITRGMERDQVLDDQTEVQCIPVRYHGQVLAVLRRTFLPSVGRRLGQLERTYISLFDRIAVMVAEGTYPFVNDDAAIGEAPRVGDGVMIVDASSRLTFASPNAVSALHRMGIRNTSYGVTIEGLGIDTEVVGRAFAARQSAIDELERHGEVVVLFRCIPLLDSGDIIGALLLVRDVTDLRRRDRLLLSKDAAIREVHHRVKNNLQTITSLLRIQARRLGPGGGQDALHEAERRIRSIAIVHELLARESGDQVPFDEIVHSLVRMAKESNVTGRPLALRVAGDAGRVSTDIATPLAVVLAELLQNAVEHAFVTPPLPTRSGYGAEWVHGGGDEPKAPDGQKVELLFRHSPTMLRVEVRDNGVGMPAGFELEGEAGGSDSLGLAIVRDLVRTQLDGTITFSSENGTVVRLEVPLRTRPAVR
jgi:two-component sensor histidine kinase